MHRVPDGPFRCLKIPQESCSVNCKCMEQWWNDVRICCVTRGPIIVLQHTVRPSCHKSVAISAFGSVFNWYGIFTLTLLSVYSYWCLCILIVRPCILIVRPCILILVYVFLLFVHVFLFLSMYSYCSSMYSYCSSMYSYRCLCILIVAHIFLEAATLTEVFPCFFLGCKANARV